MDVELHPLPGARLYAQRLDRPDVEFVVVAMFTAGITDKANRLKASLEKNDLNYSLYEVPSVHRSISAKGNDDIAFCKSNFILHMMRELQQPVLYVDADMVVRTFPSKIAEIAQAGIDFAVYNWIADTANDAYSSVPLSLDDAYTTDRFYRYSHSMDFFDSTQLICSGGVQYYNNSDRARHILSSWRDAIDQHPGVADDELLDYAFNFLVPAGMLKAAWLEKDYCRCPWWIHVCPVIDHPDLPGAASDPSRSFFNVTAQARFHVERVNRRPPNGPFPRDCLIDTKTRYLLKVTGNSASQIRKFDNKLWLGQEEF